MSDRPATAIDVERARAETPGAARVAHFNNAGCALPPSCVLGAVHAHLDREAMMGGYEAQAEVEALIEDTYDALAALIGCDRTEIALVENATRAWGMAFYAMRFAPGDRILTGRAEYASNAIAMLQVAERTGARIEIVPDDEQGRIDVAALERMIDGRTRLIALTHVPSNGGLVNPAADVGRIARRHGIPYLLDACQSVGQMPVDVAALGCDMLSATGRKFLRAPRGTGFLYVRRDWIERLEPSSLDLRAAEWTAPDRYRLHGDARRFEVWEGFVAGRIGLGVAARYALAWGLDPIRDRLQLVAGALRERLAEVPGVVLRDKGVERSAIVSFTLDGEAPADIVRRLRATGINLSVSMASSTLFDMAERGLPALLRASPHYYNTIAEVDRLVAALRAR